MTLPHHYRSVGWSWSNVSCTTSLWSVVCHFALSHNTVRMCVLTQWWDQTAGVCVLLQTLRPLHVWQPPVFPFCLYWYTEHICFHLGDFLQQYLYLWNVIFVFFVFFSGFTCCATTDLFFAFGILLLFALYYASMSTQPCSFFYGSFYGH